MFHGPPSSSRTRRHQARSGSIALSKAGHDSSIMALGLFTWRVLSLSRSARRASSLLAPSSPPSSGTGLRQEGIPMAVRAITSASRSSVFASPGKSLDALCIAMPGM